MFSFIRIYQNISCNPSPHLFFFFSLKPTLVASSSVYLSIQSFIGTYLSLFILIGKLHIPVGLKHIWFPCLLNHCVIFWDFPRRDLNFACKSINSRHFSNALNGSVVQFSRRDFRGWGKWRWDGFRFGLWISTEMFDFNLKIVLEHLKKKKKNA